MEQEEVGLGDLSSDGNILMTDSSGTFILCCLLSLIHLYDSLSRNVS